MTLKSNARLAGITYISYIVGFLASILLVIVLPLMLAGYVKGIVTQLVWLPMLVFELLVAIWLITKGVSYKQSGSHDIENELK